MAILVFGIGINDKKYPAWVNGKVTKEYGLWIRMLGRCYDLKSHAQRTTYVGCSVSENFRHYSYFYAWANRQIGFAIDGYHLDKDILVCGNKTYSENTCVFVPQEINNFFTEAKVIRGEYPVGVYFHKHTGRFKAQCSVNGKVQHLGLFSTPEEAF